MEWMGIIGPVTALLGILGVIFNWSIIKPLNAAISSLIVAIAEMKKQLHEIDEKRQAMAERLSMIEASTKSAHHRIDTLERRVNHDA